MVADPGGKVNFAVFQALRDRRFRNHPDSARFDSFVDWNCFFDSVKPCGILNHVQAMQSVGRSQVYRWPPTDGKN
jgi:hypothetical protein